MILQSDSTRLIFVLGYQPILIFLYLLLGYKILKRGRNNLSILYSMVFFLEALVYIVNIFFFFATTLPMLLFFYTFMLFCMISARVLIVIGVSIMYYTSEKIDKIKQIMIYMIYFIIFGFLLLNPGGILFDLEMGGAPQFTESFANLFILIYTLLIFIPINILNIRTYKKMRVPQIKYRFLYLFVGILIFISTFYLTVLYNTLNNSVYDIIYSIIIIPVIPAGSSFLYTGIGKEIDIRKSGK